jgi:urea transport system ATP-binding protein
LDANAIANVNSAPLLAIRNVNQFYGGSHILRDVSLDVYQGKITTLLGRNGVGKTTLLKALMGLVPIRSGEISIDAVRVEAMKPYERVAAGFGFVPQGREIFPRLTVEENLKMGLARKSGSAATLPRFASNALPARR